MTDQETQHAIESLENLLDYMQCEAEKFSGQPEAFAKALTSVLAKFVAKNMVGIEENAKRIQQLEKGANNGK